MAVLKPLKPTVNFEEAWKELMGMIPKFRDFFPGMTGVAVDSFEDKMKELEKKHKNVIIIKRRTDNEMVDYCIKKSVEAQMENIHLKKKLGEQSERWRALYLKNISLKKQLYRLLAKANLIVPEPLRNVKGIIKIDEKKRNPNENYSMFIWYV